jgi:hypothetical protein
MNHRKELLAAGIVRDFRFRDVAAYNDYLKRLALHKQEYEVLERCPCQDGTVLARILVQYNDTPLIKLWD